MSRLTALLGFHAALIVSGCQIAPSPDAVALSAPPALDAGTLASNELGRLGRQDLDAGNSGLAAQHFLEAVEKNGADASCWIGLAAAYDNLKRFDLADRAYARAITLTGETVAIINNLGYSYYLRGDRARALAELHRAVALSPDNQTVLNNIRLVRSGDLPNRRAAP